MLEQKKGFKRGLLVCEAPYHNVISQSIGFVEVVKNGESIVHGIGEKYGGRFQEVFGDGGVEEKAGFDQVGMHLVEVSGGFALLEN